MKSCRLTIICLLLLCCLACGNRPYPHAMQAADTLVNTYPDSASLLLEGLQDSIATQPRSTQMYYHLLCIKARDKAYVRHTSDSLIKQVLHYYEEESRDKKHLAEAYYYGGRVYADLGDAPQALDFYQKAAERLEGSTEYWLMKVVYGQMGSLFLFQNISTEAMNAYKKAYQYNKLSGSREGTILNMRDIGNVFALQNNLDSAMYYFQTAYQEAQKLGNQYIIGIIQRKLSDIYCQIGEYSLSKDWLLQSIQNMGRKHEMGVYSIYADLYYHMGNLDSAAYYYQCLLGFDYIYAQQEGHWGLAEIAQQKFDSQTAIKHIKQYKLCTDSIKKLTNTENVQKIHSLYNYQLREKENNKLKIEASVQKRINLFMLLLLTLSAIIFTIYYYRNKNKKYQLQNSLRELEYLNLNLKNRMEAEKESKEAAVAILKQSDIYQKFHSAHDLSDLNDKDWQELQKALNEAYKDFTYHLYSLYPVTTIELRICLLLKADISISKIALLTGRTKSAITSARKKLYEKVYGKKGGPELWDELIYSL